MQRKVINFLLLVVFCTQLPSNGYGQSFDRGLKLYRRADFSGAEQAFQEVLRGGVNRSTRAKIYKFIGLSQYMQGRKKEAAESFHSALKYDSLTELFPDEVLDSLVIEFFLQIKQEKIRRGRAGVVSTPPPPPQRYSPAPAPKKTETTNKQLGKKAPIKKVPARKVQAKKIQKKKSVSRISTGKKIKKQTRNKMKKKGKKSLFGEKIKKPKRITFGKKGEGEERPPSRSYLIPPRQARSSYYFDNDKNIWRFLPFGVGQYVNGNYKLGHAFAAGSVATLAMFGFYALKARKEQGVLEDEEDFLDSLDTRDEIRPAQAKHVDDYVEYVDALRLRSWLALAGFGIFWVGGVAEAMVNRPGLEYGLFLPDINYSGESLAFVWRLEM